MRDFRKAVATLAATGIATLGAVAATGGVANAATNVPLTGCSVASTSLLSIGLTPECEAGDGTMYNPTSFTLTVDRSYFNALGGLVSGLGVTVNWTLSCNVDGGNRAASGVLHATSSDYSETIDLQSAVGSPAPNQCTFTHLSAKSTVAITSTLLAELLGAAPFTFGVSATGDNGNPGALWAQYPGNSTICADVPANGNHGAPVQAFECQNDSANQWMYLSSGQLVHNGDCLTNTPQGELIAACQVGDSSQKWVPEYASGPGFLTNASNNECLTAPTSGVIQGSRLKTATCKPGDVGQQWHLPAVSPS